MAIGSKTLVSYISNQISLQLKAQPLTSISNKPYDKDNDIMMNSNDDNINEDELDLNHTDDNLMHYPQLQQQQ